VIVTDTAGIREPQGAIEREGIRRTFQHAGGADLVVWLSDASQDPVSAPAELRAREDKFFLPVASKIDIPGARRQKDALGISAKTAEGLPELIARITGIARDRMGDMSSPAITRERYRQQLLACVTALQNFETGSGQDETRGVHEHELRAEDLRLAVQALGRITGRVDVEDILGEIFGRFCIGK
jgi:tRNA modification GTPase